MASVRTLVLTPTLVLLVAFNVALSVTLLSLVIFSMAVEFATSPSRIAFPVKILEDTFEEKLSAVLLSVTLPKSEVALSNVELITVGSVSLLPRLTSSTTVEFATSETCFACSFNACKAAASLSSAA